VEFFSSSGFFDLSTSTLSTLSLTLFLLYLVLSFPIEKKKQVTRST